MERDLMDAKVDLLSIQKQLFTAKQEAGRLGRPLYAVSVIKELEAREKIAKFAVKVWQDYVAAKVSAERKIQKLNKELLP